MVTKILAAVTAAVLAVSAFLAFQNKQQLETQIQTRESRAQDVERNTQNLEGLNRDLETSVTNTEEAQARTQELNTQNEELTASKQEISDQIEENQDQADEIGSRADELEAEASDLASAEQAAGQITSLNEAISRLQDEEARMSAQRSNTMAERRTLDDQIEEYQEVNSAITNKRSYFDYAQVASTYDRFGFVTLSIGSEGGVVAGSTLDVIRNGSTVAKLQVRTVENNRASADVIPDSVDEGVTVRPGDQVRPASGSGSSEQNAS